MKVLSYRGLDTATIPGYEKFVRHLAAGDLRSAEVKKVGPNLYRARLDRSNRLLFSLYRHGDEPYALALEYLPQHSYEKSRFLRRGVRVDEHNVPAMWPDEVESAPQLPYVNPRLPHFHLLDKVLSFDDDQEAIYHQPPPLVIIGPAGSGKTALTLEKMKDFDGDVLYVTRSPYLAQHARDLYYAMDYSNESQRVEFLCFREYLESIHVPEGKEITPRAFAVWAARQRLPREVRDSHRLFEEIQGAIAGTEESRAYLTREAYHGLGVRQSIYPSELRPAVYDVFENYLRLLAQEGWFDPNIVSHAWLERVRPRYDLVVVDEVQDLTNVQLLLILRALRDSRSFLLCGDSNQIVHPNFFSWAKLKSLFWQKETDHAPAELIRILNANFRNSPQVTELANRLLRVKHARFGSIDRESNYLLRSVGPGEGRVLLLEDSEKVKRELDRRTATSAQFAILVLHAEQKAEVRQHFRTPLTFSIQEVKGLEYKNVLLYGFLSGEEKRFRDIAAGLSSDDLRGELRYARSRDKGDKSLEVYKFYINALYVAITRAVTNLYFIEPRTQQPLLALLGLTETLNGVEEVEEQRSSLDEWRREAHRLEQHGKDEQAAEIREQILKQRPVPWQVLRGERLAETQQRAFEGAEKKARLALLEYAVVYRDQRLTNALIAAGLSAARHPAKAYAALEKKYYLVYGFKNPTAVLRDVDRYGVDFRNLFDQTPLMVASRVGNAELVEQLLDLGANPALVDGNGLNAFQIALETACTDARYARMKLPAVYDRLAPPSLDVQVEQRLVKLDRHSMEYLMFCLAIVLFYHRLGANWASRRRALSTADFAEVLSRFPDTVVLERRKKRPYISSILSKNEVTRQGPYNRQLFLRLHHGQYLINPRLALRIEGKWRNIYELLVPERLAAQHRDPVHSGDAVLDLNAHAERAMTELRGLLARLARDNQAPPPPTPTPAPAQAEQPTRGRARAGADQRKPDRTTQMKLDFGD